MRRAKSLLFISWAAALSSAELAATDAFDRCALDPDPVTRLACFDRQVAARRSTKPVTPATTSTAAPVAASAATPAAQSEIGLDARQLRKLHPEQAAAPASASVESTVVKVLQRRPLISTFELANGQIWEQTETVAGLLVRERESVSIRKGAMGGFTLKSASGVTVRVRRIQ